MLNNNQSLTPTINPDRHIISDSIQPQYIWFYTATLYLILYSHIISDSIQPHYIWFYIVLKVALINAHISYIRLYVLMENLLFCLFSYSLPILNTPVTNLFPPLTVLATGLTKVIMYICSWTIHSLTSRLHVVQSFVIHYVALYKNHAD